VKRFFLISMLLILLLAACSPNGPSGECQEGICVSITVEGPVQALEPVLFSISVKSEKDVTGLGISVYGDTQVTILDIEKKPEEAELGYQDKNSMDWRINTTGGKEYIFSGHVVFPKPTVSYGVFSYGIIVAASQPSITRVTDSVTIYLDASGKQVEESEAKLEVQTEFPAPTPPPDLTIIPETPIPTVVWPSPTPFPSPTPTTPAYPAPGEKISTDDAGKNQFLPTPTLPAYPNP